MPLLFSKLILIQRCRGCGVATAATAVSALPSGQIWSSPTRGACTSGATPGRGGRLGMVSFVAISFVSAMVVRVIWRVARRIFCRVYVTYGTECVGIKVVKLWTISLTKLDRYVKGCARMHCYLGRLCLRPPDPYRWKAEVLSFLHVLLVWGVNLASLLNKRRQSWTIHLKLTVDGIQGLADKEITEAETYRRNNEENENRLYTTYLRLLIILHLWLF